MHNAKARGHERVSPGRGYEKRHGAEQHQAQTHDRDNAHGKRSPGDNRGSVKQKPNSGESSERANLIKSVGQKTANDNGRSKTQNKFAAGSGEEPGIGAMRFRRRSRCSYGHRNDCFDEPNDKPSARSRLARGDEGSP